MSDELTSLAPGDKLELVMGDNGTAQVFVYRAETNQPTPNFAFAWLTDIHVGRESVYGPGQPKANIAQILNDTQPAFAIVTGDCTESGTDAQMVDYLDCWPMGTAVWHLPGNHDEVGGYDDPPPNNYANYEYNVNSFRWAFSCNGCRFIGFTTNLKRGEPYNGFAWVAEEDRAFVAANLSLTERNLLFTHFPFDDSLGSNVHDFWDWDAGQEWLYDLGLQYDIVLFTGHRHMAGLNFRTDTIKEINGGCLAYDEGNVQGSYQLVSVLADRLIVNRYLGREPYNLLETVEILQ